MSKARKVELEKFIQNLVKLYEEGNNFVDILIIPAEKKEDMDIIRVLVNMEYTMDNIPDEDFGEDWDDIS